MTDPLNPLTDEHLAQINRGIEHAELALQAVAKAQVAGIDTGDSETQLRNSLSRLRGIKQVYFPGR